MIRVCCFLLIVLACIVNVQAKTYIVSTGINSYPNGVGNLKFSINDAARLKGIYEINGNVEALLVTDKDATCHILMSKLKNLFSKAKKSDTVIFFFSGHGTNKGLMCFDGVLSYESVYDVISKSNAGIKIFFADVCFAGKARKTSKRTNRKYNKDVIYFLSSRSGEPSRESYWGDTSLFTAHLLLGIKGGADTNNDRMITAKELFGFVNERVVKASGGHQHPVMWGNFNSETPIIIWK